MVTVNRISRIDWSRDVGAEDIEKNDWIVSTAITPLNTVFIYECVRDGESQITGYWIVENQVVKLKTNKGSEFLSNQEDLRKNFAGHPFIARLILCLGWLPWEDELELEPLFKIYQEGGRDCGGELNVKKISKRLQKNQTLNNRSTIVIRNVYEGQTDINIETLMDPIPDQFLVMDSYELISLVCN